MRLLLDTHALLWWLAERPLPRSAFRAIESPEADVAVSAVTIWEAAIKQASGKLRLRHALDEGVRDLGFRELPITFAHATAAGALPPLHGDPFDRMLIAQAQLEGRSIVTSDPQIARYDVHVVDAG